MGLRKNIKRLFEKTESLGFKDVHKIVKKRIRDIEKIDDPNDRLEPFKELKQMLDNVFDEHDYDVQQAVGKADKDRDGFAYYLSPVAIGAGLYMFISTISGTSVPALASYMPIILTGVATAAAAGLMVVGHVVLRKHRAKELGLTASDVKHARKLKYHHARVERHIKKIAVQETTKLHLESIRGKFNAPPRAKHAKRKHSAKSTKPLSAAG